MTLRLDEVAGLPVTMPVDQAGKLLLGMGRGKSFEQAALYLATNGAEGLPCIRVGRTLLARVPEILRQLGVEVPANAVQTTSGPASPDEPTPTSPATGEQEHANSRP